MNAVTEPLAAGYEQDFHAWTQRQAALVRTGRMGELDRDNLAEEIESVGREQFTAVKSYTFQLLVHLLCLQHSPAADPHRHWRAEVRRFRRQIERRLEDSPSLRPRMAEALAREWPSAREEALDRLAQDGVRALPAECPYSVAQVLDAGWLPPGAGTPR